MTDEDDLAPISLRDSRLRSDPEARPWSWRLQLFVRALAILAFMKGLVHWALLMGVGGGAFGQAPLTWRIGTVTFAVADLVAAVGLWLGAAWGVAMWLIAAAAQMLFTLFAPDVFPFGGVAAVAEAVAMAVYLGLSLKSRREQR